MQYIAEKKILAVNILEDQKTPAGAEMVEVAFEDDTREVMPRARFEIIATEEISDASGVQTRFNDRISSLLFSILHEYGVKFGEIDKAFDGCVNLANNGLRKSQDILFGCEPKEITLIGINNILLKNAKENNNGSASTGGESDTPDTK